MQIEQENQPHEDLEDWPAQVETIKAINSEVKKTWIYYKLIPALFLATAISAVLWFSFIQKTSVKNSSELIVAEKNTPQNTPAHENMPSGKAQPSEVIKPAPVPVIAPKPAMPAAIVSEPPAPAKATEKISQPLEVSQLADIKQPSATSTEAPEKSTIKPVQKKPEPIEIKKIEAEKTEQERRTKPVQPLKQAPPPAPEEKIILRETLPAEPIGQPLPSQLVDNSWLKLQAVSWSEIPKSRIAVINNQVVREGDAVDEGRVKRIGNDYVIIRSRSEDWLLNFSLQR